MATPRDLGLRATLKALPLFAQISDAVREPLLSEAFIRRVAADEWLFRQGEPGDALYVISSGRFEVVREEPAPAAVLRQLGAGAAIGELALLTGAPRSATVHALRDSELVVVRREEMLRLLHESQPFAIALTQALGRLLQASEPPPRRPLLPRVLAVVPLQPPAPVGPFCHAFLDATKGWARVAVIRRGDVPGSDDPEHFAGHGRLLDERERAHDHVLLVGGQEQGDAAWNAYCVRQADRVVGLTLPCAPPGPGGPSTVLHGCDLVLWGPYSDTARVVGAWLDLLQPRRHHFVEPGLRVAETAGRTARRLTGRSLGIVLSGGGAGGLAHLGVLQTLSDGGVPIDRVGGCSFGAFVGGLFAMGRSPEHINAICHAELVARNPFNDYWLPRRALLRGKKGERALTRIFAGARIEELPRDYFCVAADLLTDELVVRRRHAIADAVLASMSVPGIGPPIPYEGRLLVDGGVLNNLPVDVMADRHEGPIIAVDVMRRRLRPGEDAPLAGGQPRTRRRARPGPRLLGIHETLMRATVLGSWGVSVRNRARAQLVITPDVRGIGFFDFRRLEQVVDAGRRAAEEVLDDARALAAGRYAPPP